MSLKVVHIFFIVCALVLSVGYGLWSLQMADRSGQSSLYKVLGLLSLIVSVTLVVYLKWFVRKQKGTLR